MQFLIDTAILLVVLITTGIVTGFTARFVKKKKYSFGTKTDLMLGLAGGLTGGLLLYIIELHYHGYILPAVSAVITTVIVFYVVNVIKK